MELPQRTSQNQAACQARYMGICRPSLQTCRCPHIFPRSPIDMLPQCALDRLNMAPHGPPSRGESPPSSLYSNLRLSSDAIKINVFCEEMQIEWTMSCCRLCLMCLQCVYIRYPASRILETSFPACIAQICTAFWCQQAAVDSGHRLLSAIDGAGHDKPTLQIHAPIVEAATFWDKVLARAWVKDWLWLIFERCLQIVQRKSKEYSQLSTSFNYENETAHHP